MLLKKKKHIFYHRYHNRKYGLIRDLGKSQYKISTWLSNVEHGYAYYINSKFSYKMYMVKRLIQGINSDHNKYLWFWLNNKSTSKLRR